MSHYYGRMLGSRGEATRCGTKDSGMITVAAGWGGAIRVQLFQDEGVDMFAIEQIPWEGTGVSQTIACGEIGQMLDTDFNSGKFKILTTRRQKREKEDK